MPSRRRARTKNLGTNLADVQRRMRYLERRPVRTKLQRKIITAVNIVPDTITADEVNFGTVVTTPETDINNVDIQNPKDGLLVVSTTDGSSSIYSGNDDTYYPITDPIAQGGANAATEEAQAAAEAAQAAAEAAAAADAAAAQAAADAAAADAAAAEAQNTADQGVLDAEAAAQAAQAAQESADMAAAEAADALLAANSAVDTAEAAASSAITATESANKKNSVFRAPAAAYAPASAPTANSIGDIWFDTTPLSSDVTQTGTPAGGAKPKRWNGTSWEPFGLSYAAITSLDADTITAGTLTGRTVKTSASGNRVEMSNTDVITFYSSDTTIVGTIQPGAVNNEGLYITAGSGGSSISMYGSGYADDSSISLTTNTGGGAIYMFDDSYGSVASGGGTIVTGNFLSLRGGVGGFEIKDNALTATIYGGDGSLSLLADTTLNIGADKVVLSGSLVLGFGTYVQGTGAPTAGADDGTIIFKYT